MGFIGFISENFKYQTLVFLPGQGWKSLLCGGPVSWQLQYRRMFWLYCSSLFYSAPCFNLTTLKSLSPRRLGSSLIMEQEVQNTDPRCPRPSKTLCAVVRHPWCQHLHRGHSHNTAERLCLPLVIQRSLGLLRRVPNQPRLHNGLQRRTQRGRGAHEAARTVPRPAQKAKELHLTNCQPRWRGHWHASCVWRIEERG